MATSTLIVTQRDQRSQLQLALKYARMGIPVHPLSPQKKPLTTHGFRDATTDEATIHEWWRRWPNALVGAPTGPRTGFWVLDLDGEAGQVSLNHILAAVGLESTEDLSPVVVRTPSGGLHLYFAWTPGSDVRTRAGDIATGTDTRGVGGYIILPGNRLPNGRGYELIGPADNIVDLPFAPPELVYLATFNKRERAEIMAQPVLRARMRDAGPAEWAGILQAHRDAQTERLSSLRPAPDDHALRRQAMHDIAAAAREYAARQDGRRNGLFSVACKNARYAAHGVISEHEFHSTLLLAAHANGAITEHGQAWFNDTLRRALAYGSRDALPVVARCFRLEGAA